MGSLLPDITSFTGKNLYRTMLDALPSMVYHLDNEYHYDYTNTKYNEWLGKAGSLIGKDLNEGLEHESYELIKKYADLALGGDTVHFEADIRLSNCSCSISIDATFIPDRDDQKKIRGYSALLQDVTEKKKIYKNLENKNKELQDYIDHAPVGLHWVDSNGVIIWANKAELDMLGYTAEEYIGHSIEEFHVDKRKISYILSSLSNNQILDQYESELRCKDGSTVPVHISSNVLWEDEKFVHTRCFTINITEQKKLFEALQKSDDKFRQLSSLLENKVEERTHDIERKNEELRKNEERYQKMISEVEDYAILVLNRDGIVQNWNKGAEKIKGYKEHEIVGKSFKLFYLPSDRQTGLPEKLIGEAIETGKASQEGWRVRKNGSTFWGSVLITALHNNMSEIIGFTKVTRDLTERKIAEEKLRKYAQELEFQNKELEQFSYAASHDMKEPLRKIIFYNTFINDGAGKELPEKERIYLTRSIAAAVRLQHLIDDLLSYSKTTLQIEDFELVDLNKVLEEVISSNKEAQQEDDVIFEIDQLPVVRAIDFQMSQLFNNLVENSIKYQHPGRKPLVRITCEKIPASQLQFHEESLPFKSYYKISIIDNGIGFDQVQSEKIFELFQRLHEKRNTAGTGIGLAICRKIIQNHLGFIEAAGKLNEGCQFFVYLPYHE